MSVLGKHWMVTQDGRPLMRGLTHQEAYAQAHRLTDGMEGHLENEKQRVPEYAVAEDTDAAAVSALHYRLFKQGDRMYVPDQTG